jgi:Carboxypeptidase regulatory-like domain
MKFLFALFILMCGYAAAQEKQMFTVSGRVTDEGGRPLEGVQIWAAGPRFAKRTDAEGLYTIQVPYSQNAFLRFLHKGYGDKRVNINGSTVVNASLSRRYERDSFRYVIKNAGMPVTFFTQPEPDKEKGRDEIYTRVEIEASYMGSLNRVCCLSL